MASGKREKQMFREKKEKERKRFEKRFPRDARIEKTKRILKKLPEKEREFLLVCFRSYNKDFTDAFDSLGTDMALKTLADIFASL